MPSCRVTNAPSQDAIIGTFNEELGDSGPLIPGSTAAMNAQSTPRIDSVIHALLIGIDHYSSPDIQDLQGAAADADAVEKYLKGLNVSVDIEKMRDQEATRQAILEGLGRLQERTLARKDDLFVIFFVGHGTTAKAPINWPTTTKKVSMIVPHDGTKGETEDETKGINDYPGKSAHNIPDRTIGALLRRLAEKLGDEANILVIFDCCHSGSGTRASGYDAVSNMEGVRGFELDPSFSIPADLDTHIWAEDSDSQPRGMQPARGHVKSGLNSHILLAACAEDEFAAEAAEKHHIENTSSDNLTSHGTKRGKFTTALLQSLKKKRDEADRLSYQALIEEVKQNIHSGQIKQTPRCEGHGTNRLLSDALVPSAKRVMYQVDVEDDVYVLNVGSIHGIVDGARFSIYPTPDLLEEDRKMVLASGVKKMKCRLANEKGDDFRIGTEPRLKFALPITLGPITPLRWFALPNVRALAQQAVDLFDDERGDGVKPCFVGEAGLTHVDLSLRLQDGSIHYTLHVPEIGYPEVHDLNISKKAREADVRSVYRVLRSASYFFWHLRRASEDSSTRELFEVEAHALQKSNSIIDVDYVYQEASINLLKSGVLEAEADSETVYGFKVRNTSNFPMHVWAFYFDFSDLSIIEYYQPPDFHLGCEASLPGGKCLMVGYGASGGQPFVYTVPEGRDSDIGLVRFFLSTRPVDLSSVAQEGVFERPADDGEAARTSKRVPMIPAGDWWYTRKVVIVQCRSHAQ